MHNEPQIMSVNQAPPNPLLLLHGFLRGRYWLMIPLACAFAIPGAIGGYLATKPKYESIGLIQITPSIDPLLGDSPDVMPMFEQFINSEAALVESPRVIQKALEFDDDLLVRQGWPGGKTQAGIRRLANAVSASVQRNTNFIIVRASHTDPRTAGIAAKAVIGTYMELYGNSAANEVNEDKAALDSLSTLKQAEIIDLEQRIVSTLETAGFEGNDLDIVLDNLLRMVMEYEVRLADINLTLDSYGDSSLDAAPQPAIDDVMLEAMFPEFAALQSKRRAIEIRLNVDLAGVSEDHRSKRETRVELASTSKNIEELRPILRARLENQPLATPDAIVADLERQQQSISFLLEDAKARLERASTASLEIQKINRELWILREDLRQINSRRESLAADIDRYRERIQVRDEPEVPVAPATDRRLPLAAAGALGGAGFIVLLFAGLGLLDHRLRFVEQISDSTFAAPLLGVLPTLGGAKSEQRQLAAECVHHLRNMVEVQLDAMSPGTTRLLAGAMPCAKCGEELRGLSIRESCPSCGQAVAETILATIDGASRSSKGRSVVITSAGAGDGKTSVTAALGMSFATAGRRTVVVDADLIGRGLSDSLGLGEAPGLTELTGNDALNGELHATEVQNLWALPAGRDSRRRPEQLGKEFVASLINMLESKFEVVLIDTGPLLGSLEANLVAGRSQGVLMVVSKGQDGKHVQTSLRRLGEIGANCLGLVYNRATSTDINRSSSAMSGSRSVHASKPKKDDGRPLVAVMNSST